MATGGVAGAIIVALGGAATFWVAAIVVIVMAVIACGAMWYVYQQKPADEVAKAVG